MVSKKAMSIANTDASVINKLANGKPPVPAKQRVKQRTIHVNLETWVCGAVRETMLSVECSIVLNGAAHFSNYLYFEILYTRASNEDTSSSFLQRRRRPSLHSPWSLGAACF